MTPLLDRALFHLDPGRIWVMHCAEGPVPRASADAARRVLDAELRPWEMDFGRDLLGIPDAVRAGAAAVLGGADPADVSLTQSTSSGLVLLAHAFPWERGDEVVVPLGEFPANAWPWKSLAARGVAFREVPLWDGHAAGPGAWSSAPPSAGAAPEDRLAAALGPRTRVLAASWVRFQDGLRLDLARLGLACAARGVALVVDGIQGAGIGTPDLSTASAFVTGGHKGLLGPAGQGFLWTAPDFRARIVPAGSWLSVVGGDDFSRPGTDLERDWRPDGRRLDQGNYNLLGAAALAGSLRLLADTGVDRIAAHVASLRGMLLDRLAATPAWAADAARLRALDAAGRLGPIVALHHGGRGSGFLDAILKDGFARGVFASVREGYLRIALHGYHGDRDVDAVADWLAGAPG